MMMKKINILFLLLLIGLTAVDMFGQATTATFIGYATDTSGNFVVGAKVTAVNEATGLTRTVITGKNGEYVIPQLPIGRYSLTFEAEGFKQSGAKRLTLQLDQKVRVNTVMEVGDIKDSVAILNEEGGGVQLIDSETAEVGEVIQNNRIVDLPLNGRLFLQLAQLTPGVIENARGSFAQQLAGFSGPRITVMGARESDNYFTLDGVSLTDRFFNTMSIPVSVDALQEFKVQSKLYSAQAGTLGGAQVNIAIKSGTNSIHGSVYGFIRNDRLNARNFFDSDTKSKFRQGQYGGTIGGAVVENKFFYFGNYEGLRKAQSLTRLFTVPTKDQRSGIFTTPVIDPTTRRPFANNTIPDNRISLASKALLGYVPLPNTAGLVNNFIASPDEINDSDQFTVKTNFKMGDRDDFAARYTFYELNAFQPYGFVIFNSSNTSLPGFGQFLKQRSQNIGLTHTHVFNPNLVGEFRAGFNRTAGGQTQENNNLNFAGTGLIAGMSSDPGDYGLPRIIAGPLLFGDVSSPLSRRDNDTQAGYNLSLFKGRDNINIGGVYRRLEFNPFISVFPRGQFSFTGDFSGNAFADFLLGAPRVALGGQGVQSYLRGNEYAAYIQDDIKLSRRFTLNLGMRWDYFSPFSEKNNRWATIDIENQRIIVASEDGNTFPRDQWIPGIEAGIAPFTIVKSEDAGIDRSLSNKDLNNFAPRIGFALDLFGNQKSVLRAGYGIFYNVSSLNGLSLQSLAPPFINTASQFIPFPNPANSLSNVLKLKSLPGFQSYDMNYRTPYYQQWSLGLQQLIAKDLLIEANYVGSKGTKLYTVQTLNEPDPSPILAFVQPSQQRAPYPFLGGISRNTGAANSNYHAGLLRVEKRLSRGLMVMGSYTFSKSIDNDSLGNSVVTSALDQSKFKNLERAVSSFDIRHRFITSFTYDLPYKSSRSALKGLLGNWQVGGIITQQSGQPFTVNLTGDRANIGRLTQRPNLVGDANLPSDQRTVDRWFNTDAFVIQPFGTLGNAGRNVLEGPGFNQVDMSLLKNIPFNERHRLQFRTEFFNILNHANFEVPNRTCAGSVTNAPCTSQGFGSITAARDPRIIQFGLKYLF